MTIATILLIDDEISFVETMAKRLTKRNFKVISAFSGDDGLNQIKQHSGIEIVILDVKMPGKNGIETLKEIKQFYPLVEVIMLTGHATVETGIEGMKLGAFDYMMKPCDMDQLLSKLTEAAEKKQKHEEKIVDARLKEITARHP